MTDKPTFCGQPIDQGELHPGREYPNEGYAILSCGGTKVVLGYTLLHHLEFYAEKESPSWLYPQLVAANKALHAITAEASIGRKGFTLIELLTVLAIIGLISVLALPTVIPAISHRQVSEGARLLQAGLAGARDRAALTGRPAGIRLMLDPSSVIKRLPDGTIDPTSTLIYNRWVPIEVPANYSEGNVTIFDPATYPDSIRTVNGYAGVPCLVLEEAVLDANGLPNPPTSWFWNIRVGDKIQVNNAGPWYTICGPMLQPNPEQFVNVGPPGTKSSLQRGATFPEFLLLVNGRDDNGDGWVDSGFDGIDNNRETEKKLGLPFLTDDPLEWEVEKWLGSLAG